MQELIFLDFWFLTASKTKLKQEQKQSKEIGTERLPFPVASKSPATAPENCLMATSWWTPRGRLWCRQQRVFPWISTQGYRTSRTWMALERCCCREVALPPPTTWNLHRNKPELCPTRNREVVNPSGLAEQRISSTVWKIVVLAGNSNRVLQQVFVNSM